MLAALIGLAFLVWDCVEVGRNDATNLVNAVFGARVMRRRTAILIAGVAVCIGLNFTARIILKRKADAHEAKHHRETTEEDEE